MILGVLVALGIGLTLLTAGFFGISEVYSVLAGSNMGIVALAVLAQIAGLALLGVRLKIVASRYGQVSYWRAFRIMAVAMVTDFLTPVAKVGGEPIKIAMLQRRFGGPKASAIVAVDMLAELVTSLIAVLLVLFFLGAGMPLLISTGLFIFVIIMLVAIAIFYKVFTSLKWLRRVVNWSVRRVARFKKIQRKDYAPSFGRAVKILSRDRKAMGGTIATSFLQKFFEVIRIWLAFLALGVVLPWHVILIVWAFTFALFLIPWLPGNLGLMEFGSAGAFVLLGVAGTAAAGGVLLDRFISFWLVLMIGLAFAWFSGAHMTKAKGG